MNFKRKLGYVALGSVGTIIGLIFGNVLSLFAVNGKSDKDDLYSPTITCKIVRVMNNKGQVTAAINGGLNTGKAALTFFEDGVESNSGIQSMLHSEALMLQRKGVFLLVNLGDKDVKDSFANFSVSDDKMGTVIINGNGVIRYNTLGDTTFSSSTNSR